MGTDLYTLTVPPLLRGLAAMDTILDKALALAEAKGIPHQELLDTRLADDMDPFVKQVQRVSDAAKFGAVRLAALEAEPMPDTETSFAELKERIARTRALVERVAPEAINGREDAQVELVTPRGRFPFTGIGYLQLVVLPNFYFHLTVAYGLMRQKGAELGKLDYLGPMPQPPQG